LSGTNLVFFVLAKILWFVLQPSTIMLGAVVAGTGLLHTSYKRLGRGLLIGGIAALLIAGLSPLGDILIRPLEQRFARADLDKAGAAPVTGIIVLGGAEDSRAMNEQELAALNEAAERHTEAAALARRLPGARIVFSGGSGALLRTEAPEAESAKRLLVALGIAADRITLEDKSRDTCENAAFTAALVKPHKGEHWLLVTSAAHMPRAMGCFRRAGFPVEAWPVDYRAPRRLDLTRWHSSIPEGLRRVDHVAREYAGLLAYYLAGRTDALFPGP
jgi:uncharacterized SAM-binding protein YcdF (DUF218 family)